MTLIKLNWSGVKGEGTVRYTKEFTEAHIVVQLDMLQDCIIQLCERYAELGKRDAISAKIFYDFLNLEKNHGLRSLRKNRNSFE